MQVPLFGLGVGTRSSNVSAQSRTNLYAEQLGEADKSPMALYSRPGLTRLSVIGFYNDALHGPDGSVGAIRLAGQRLIDGPVRGLDVLYSATGYAAIWGVMGNIPFAYQAGRLRRVWADYSALSGLTTRAGRVALVNDGINVAIADGAAGYYVSASVLADFATSLNNDLASFTPIGSNFPQTATSLTVVASHVIANDPTTVGRFYWSDAGDVTTWDALSFATAESCPDPLTCVFEANGELLLFGLSTLEYWAPTGDASVFTRIGSSGAQWGTDAVDTIRKVGNRVMFLGRSQAGTYSVLLVDGYAPNPVSTPDVDTDINNSTGLVGATATVVSWRGHTFYVLKYSSTKPSWAYDLTTGSWSLWSTEDGPWAGLYQTQFVNQTIVSDYRDGRMYYLDDVYSDDGNMMVREVTSRHQSSDLDRLSCYELVVDCETGIGLTSGQGSDPQAMLSISKDGGHTWSSELWTTMGALGEYTKRLVWRRLGLARDWLFKLRITDPVKVVLIGASARFDK